MQQPDPARMEYHHSHEFLGAGHERNERKTWAVIILCGIMMVVEIVGGGLFGSLALVADGLHMSTHSGAMLIAALAYTYARRHVSDRRFVFGTGKLGDLAGFSSAIVLAMMALLIGYEAISRLLEPVPIRFREAIPIACVGLVVNIVSAWLLSGDHHEHDHGHDHDDHHDRGHDRGPRTPAAVDHHHHDHDHDHGRDQRLGHDHHAHHTSATIRDNSIRSAYVHVLADAVVSVLAITGLLLARSFGWLWMDPVAGIIGALVIANWSYGLIKDTGRVLLDVCPDQAATERMRQVIEVDGDSVADLHLWRLGPGHLGAVLSVVTDKPRDAAFYRGRLRDFRALSHVTVEVARLGG
ncbi:MAG TPA: CDF family Co(II)/Ni(II) efflux transporter DmeF [Steroidobacteraceae bacterium]|nr:CDF family Co(II)/Ni(II) efflux transporter DmeF [Steroidobacteraceae bacterium]